MTFLKSLEVLNSVTYLKLLNLLQTQDLDLLILFLTKQILISVQRVQCNFYCYEYVNSFFGMLKHLNFMTI